MNVLRDTAPSPTNGAFLMSGFLYLLRTQKVSSNLTPTLYFVKFIKPLTTNVSIAYNEGKLIGGTL